MQNQTLIDGTIEPTRQPKIPPVKRTHRPTKAEEHELRNWEKVYNPAPWQPQIPTPEEEHFRHSGWRKKRAAVRAAMATNGVPMARLERFDCCGSGLTIEHSEEEGRYRVIGSYCHDRHCEPCMRAKANIIAKNLRAKIEAMKPIEDCGKCHGKRGLSCDICGGNGRIQPPQPTYRFITLTLRHTAQPLKQQITRLMHAFRKLRNSKPWKRTQKGGSVSLEVKWKADTQRWHPHLHIIADGSFLEKETLSAEWHIATEDSFVTDIRQLKDAKEAAYYVSKYAAKGVNAEVWSDPDAAKEWLSAIHGVRTCGTWGTWRGYRLTEHKVESKGWKYVGTLNEIIARAKRAERVAVAILEAIVHAADREEVRATYIMETGDG